MPGGAGALSLQASLPSTPSSHVTFGGTGNVGVLKDAFTLSFGGVASLSAIQQQFSTTGGTPPVPPGPPGPPGPPVPPVPEPTTLALLGIGLAGLGMTRLRRKA